MLKEIKEIEVTYDWFKHTRSKFYFVATVRDGVITKVERLSTLPDTVEVTAYIEFLKEVLEAIEKTSRSRAPLGLKKSCKAL